MSDTERGPLLDFEVTWRSGQIETISAHQCTLPSPRIFGLDDGNDDQRRITFHGEIGGRWQLILTAPEAEILTVRNVTAALESR